MTRRIIKCPSCAHEISVPEGADLSRLACPICEAEVPEEALRAESEIVEELAPGFRPGQRLGNYVIESRLGSGGMAVVFRGRQLSLNRHVAIKILPRDLAKNKVFLQRFESEAAVLASLNHPNIVSVIDRGREGEICFIVMEYVEGETLKERLRRRGRLPPDEVIPIVRQVLAGLDYAHRRGVVHRDIKPGNIMIDHEEVVKLADFGLAHLAKGRGGRDITRDHQTMGTLKYMAPEQLTSPRRVDARADLYSVGVCIYEMLTGRLPLGAFKVPTEVDPTLDVRWDDLVLRALKMDPADRFGSAAEMAALLKEIASTPLLTAKEREEQEAAAAAAEAAPSLTACLECGRESAPDARQCEHCGASLEDLFDKCPSCGKENRLDVARCAACGAGLAAHRERRRRTAEAIQKRAKELIERRQFDSALAELEKLLRFGTREYSIIRERARLWMQRVRERRERHLTRIYEAGLRMIAEERYERALQLWQNLPDDYADVGKRRKEILAQKECAVEALKKGDGLYKQGDVEGALAAWEEAAKFWPRSNQLRRRIERARIERGNRQLKQSYLADVHKARARGDLTEALVLCRRVLDLDPDDRTALDLLHAIEAEQREQMAREADSSPELILPIPRTIEPPRRIGPVAVGLIVILLFGAALTALVIFVYIPYAQRQRDARAVRLLSQAEIYRGRGEFEQAIAVCERLVSEYGRTPTAQAAADMAASLRQMLQEARSLRQAAEQVAKKGDFASLTAAFRMYRDMLRSSPVAEIREERENAETRLEGLRATIGRQLFGRAQAHEQKGEWHEALRLYRSAVEEYGCRDDRLRGALQRAEERVERCLKMVARAEAAMGRKDWEEALRACGLALDAVPADPKANALLARIGPRLEPPPGMVFVPAGDYVVGGAEGNPRRTVHIPHGFFIDRSEVTNERYAEFLRATGHPPPKGWSKDGRPPAGREDLPVVNVSWKEAAAFAEWAGLVLPTEEEWECAARGKDGKEYPWGDEWDGSALISGLGPAPVDKASRDVSPFGCVNMAGNVAEWTSTPAPAARSSETGQLYIVKGSAWIGLEQDRPTRAVPLPVEEQTQAASGNPAFPPGVRRPPMPAGRRPVSPGPAGLLLAPAPFEPEVPLLFPVDREILYKGSFAEPQRTVAVVRRWLPDLARWVEANFLIQVGKAEPIGGRKPVGLRLPGRGMTTVRRDVDFSTGCVAVGQGEDWIDIRDPSGVVRRLRKADKPILRPPPGIRTPVSPAKLPKVSLRRTARAAERMVGRADGRYVNVGFRCIKPLWRRPAAGP